MGHCRKHKYQYYHQERRPSHIYEIISQPVFFKHGTEYIPGFWYDPLDQYTDTGTYHQADPQR